MIIKPKIKKTYIKKAAILLLAIVFTGGIISTVKQPEAKAQILITSGTTWTVPSNWNNNNNSIETIGAGGGGGGGFHQPSNNGGPGGGGGGAGAYSRANNITLSRGSTVTIAIGAGGGGGASSANGTAGGDTYVCNDLSNCASINGSAVVSGAKGGAGGGAGASAVVGAGGAAGQAADGIGILKYNGGAGGIGGDTSAASGGGGGGGGGAAGPNAAGNNGANAVAQTRGSGGQGDGTFGGAGGTVNSGNGSNGTEFGASHGSGGGAAGGDGSKTGIGSPGGSGGFYGAAGAGGGGNGNQNQPGGAGGTGRPGLIRITYSYTTLLDYRWRSDDGNESSGTSLAAQNTPASVNYGSPLRLRFSVVTEGDTSSNTYRLEYAPYTDACGSWTAVPNSAASEHFNMYDTSHYSDQAASSNVSSGPGVITDPGGFSFTAGKLVKSPSNSAAVTLAAGQFTELEYAFTANSNANSPGYCFRLTNAGTELDAYNNYPLLYINYPPSAPTIYSVTGGSANVSRLPVFQIKSTDFNSDYLRYAIELCEANSFPCVSGARTYDQTASQICWSQQNAQSGTAFESSGVLARSTMAYCHLETADILSSNTIYYMRARAIDPGGSNAFGAYSSVVSFTTASLDTVIEGGAEIRGGSQIGN